MIEYKDIYKKLYNLLFKRNKEVKIKKHSRKYNNKSKVKECIKEIKESKECNKYSEFKKYLLEIYNIELNYITLRKYVNEFGYDKDFKTDKDIIFKSLDEGKNYDELINIHKDIRPESIKVYITKYKQEKK